MRLILCIPARNEASHIQDAVLKLARALGSVEVRSTEYGVRGDGEGSGWTGSDGPNGRGPIVRGDESDGPRGSGSVSPILGPNVRGGVRMSEGEVDWQIIVAVNGSTDGTAERAREVRSTEYGVRVEVVECPVAGKGAAIRHAAKYGVRSTECGLENDLSYFVHGTSYSQDFIFGFIDADLSADPDAIPGMVEKIINNEADVVIASRWLQLKTTNRAFFRNATSWIFNLFAHALLGIQEKDAQCGLKIMNRRATELLANCQEDGWFLDIEFLAKARQYGLRVLEVPVPWIEFRYPDRKSQIRHIRDGVGALRAMLGIRRDLNRLGARSSEPGMKGDV